MNKTILIAENSKLVKNILTSSLKNAGFEILEAQNGVEVISEIKISVPDLVLCSSTLPVIPGLELSRIIKTQSSLSTPIIVYSLTDDNISKTMIKKSKCDDYFILDTDEIDSIIQKLNQYFESAAENTKVPTEKDSTCSDINAINEIINFYEKESEELNIVAAINNIFEGIEDLRQACLNILSSIADFVPYDIILLSIYNEDKVHEYCSLRAPISNTELQDFMSVCHNKFLSNCNTDHQISFLDCVFSKNDFDNANHNSYEKIKTIETAIISTKDSRFLGSITIGFTKSEYMNNLSSRRFQLYSQKLTPYIMNVITQYKMDITINNLRKAFSSFVPEEIIDDLIKKAANNTETAGEKRRVAVLVCDIRNFTSISERNKAEDVVSFLNSYFTQMVEIIKSNGGSIDKFMGDAIMALFGAPISYEDNAQRAVNAAIEMINSLPKIDYSQLNMPDGIDHISIGVGIHFGEVILGSIGCEDKKDYTVIGDSVNLSSRLEGLTKLYGNHLVISDSVKQELNKDIKVHKLDKVAVKGKRIPVWIYSVETDLDNASEEYYNNYNKGMELYEVGAWSLAKTYFERATSNNSSFKSAQLMLERCKTYIENPPDNWDGAVVLTSK